LKRGEIWTASGGPDYAGKPRPVLIVQDDAFAETGSVTVCLITTQALDVGLVRPALEPGPATGLREPSWVMADRITTVPRGRLGRRLGRLAPAEMPAVNRAMMVFLGLTSPSSRQRP